MKLFYLFALLLFHNAFYAQDFKGFNHGGTTQKKYYTEVPYKITKGKITITVEIKGKNYQFLLDTGAPTAILNKLYNDLQPQKLSPIVITDQSGLKDSVQTVSIDAIGLNGLVFNDIPALHIDDMGPMACLNIDGIIGSNLLRNSIVQINPKSKTVIITDNIKLLKLNKRNSVKMVVDKIQSSPLISIVFETEKISVNESILIDTGMTDFYDLSVGVLKNAEEYKVFEVLNTATGAYSLGLHGIAEPKENYKVHVPNINIGKFMFTNVTTNTTYDNRSRMGTAFLDHGTITLDYKNGRFYFEPFEGQEQISMANKTWPIDLVLKDKKAVIGIVWDKALQEKLKTGDEVIQFGNINYSEMDECAIVIADTKVIVGPAELTVKDAETGQIKKVLISEQ